MGTPKETQPLTVFAFGKYWARPLKNENRLFAQLRAQRKERIYDDP